MVITQERNESFVTKVEMFYEDNEPSKTQYFKEGSYVFPRRGRRVPVQWCNAALQPKFALLLQSLIYFEGNSSLINQGIMQLLMDLCIYHQSRLLWRGPLACRQQNCDAIQDLNERSCPCNHSFYSTIVISPCHCSRQSFSLWHLSNSRRLQLSKTDSEEFWASCKHNISHLQQKPQTKVQVEWWMNDCDSVLKLEKFGFLLCCFTALVLGGIQFRATLQFLSFKWAQKQIRSASS